MNSDSKSAWDEEWQINESSSDESSLRPIPPPLQKDLSFTRRRAFPSSASWSRQPSELRDDDSVPEQLTSKWARIFLGFTYVALLSVTLLPDPPHPVTFGDVKAQGQELPVFSANESQADGLLLHAKGARIAPRAYRPLLTEFYQQEGFSSGHRTVDFAALLLVGIGIIAAALSSRRRRKPAVSAL